MSLTHGEVAKISAKRAQAVLALNELIEGLPLFKKAAMKTTAEGKIIEAAHEAIKAIAEENRAFAEWLQEGVV